MPRKQARRSVRKLFTKESDQLDFLVEVARAYYEQGHDQEKIANSLGISRSQVSRYLSQARTQNLVQVRVVAPGDRLSSLENSIKDRFPSLREAIVAPAYNLQPEPLRKTIGRACARYLEAIIRPGMRICMGSGRTLAEVFAWLHPRNIANVSVIQAMGNVGHEAMHIDFNAMARAVAHAFGARVYYLNSPAILGSGSVTELEQDNPSIREALQMVHSADVHMVGIGSMEDDWIFTRDNVIRTEDLEQLIKAGAVGDICARFFDCNGVEIPSVFANRIVGISLEDLKNSSLSIGVGGGVNKVAPLRAALHGGFLRTLITDEQTALGILEIDQQLLQKKTGEQSCK